MVFYQRDGTINGITQQSTRIRAPKGRFIDFDGIINMEIPGMGPAKQKITGQHVGNCKK
jgi:hypothetical protein